MFSSLIPSTLNDLVLTTVSIALNQSRYQTLHLSGNDVCTELLFHYNKLGSLLQLVMNTSAGGFTE